jgi:hypothetical protein
MPAAWIRKNTESMIRKTMIKIMNYTKNHDVFWRKKQRIIRNTENQEKCMKIMMFFEEKHLKKWTFWRWTATSQGSGPVFWRKTPRKVDFSGQAAESPHGDKNHLKIVILMVGPGFGGGAPPFSKLLEVLILESPLGLGVSWGLSRVLARNRQKPSKNTKKPILS